MANYTVQKGDTLSEIAKKYGTTYQEIAKANGISNPNIIQIGQQLKIGNDTPAATTPAATTPETPAATQFPTQTPTQTTPTSNVVQQANDILNQHLANKPGEMQGTWSNTLQDTINKILNREKFSYDLNGDMLYQQYKDQYTTQGKMAMMDTMGQAAAMTGGYGNSYAQSVGQQAYQGYLQGLNDKIPELYQLALSQYNAEGDALYNQASILAQMDEQEYGRYRDKVSDWYADRDYLTGAYTDARDFDYGKQIDDRNYNYQIGQDAYDKQNNAYDKLTALIGLGYNPTDEELSAAGMTREQANAIASAYTTQTTGSTGSTGGGGSSGKAGSTVGGYTANPGLTKSEILSIQKQAGITEDGIWGPNTAKAYDSGIRPKGGADAFTGTTYKEAAAYLKSNGKSSGGLMTASEWARHKNSNNSAGGEHEASSYQEYLEVFIYDAMN